jgi:hypothetical protein
MLAVCKQLRGLTITVGVVLAALIAATSANAVRPLNTGIEVFGGDSVNLSSNLDNAFPKVHDAGANYVRLVLLWRTVAPAVEPTNPADPTKYNWSGFDPYVAHAVAQGLTPLITVWKAPEWAENHLAGDPATWNTGAVRPNAVLFGKFATAAAQHYHTLYPTLHPAWEAWNEPNLRHFLVPQQNPNGSWASPSIYRGLLNQFYAGIKTADPNAVVVGGSTAPFGNKTQPGPLLFLRKVVCLSNTNHRAGSCSAKANAWSTHPYTQGGPTHHAVSPNNVSLGDLPEMRRALTAATRVGHLPTVRFWVSEFGWDSRGPDSAGVPMARHARWTSEALYRAWLAGVSVFVFHQLRDRPLPKYPYQAGLYYCGAASVSTDDWQCEASSFSFNSDVKKKSWRAAYFPFVAYAGNGRIKIWGRTPNSVGGKRIIIQRKLSGGRYRNLFGITANSVGIFTKSWSTSISSGYLRAKIANTVTTSLPFSVVPQRDRSADPWGTGG